MKTKNKQKWVGSMALVALLLSLAGRDTTDGYAANGVFKKSKSDGVELQKHLDSLVAELNSVVAAITASRAPVCEKPAAPNNTSTQNL